MKSIEDAIGDLVKTIHSKFPGSKFGLGADKWKIQNFELAFDVVLPESYKVFLQHFNGGFIPGLELETMIMSGEYDMAEKLSTRFLGIEDIIEEYESLSLDHWKLNDDFEGFYPYIPFCIGDYNEKLVFVDQGRRDKESAVYLALHDEPASFWFPVADNFTSFLKLYVESEGQPCLSQNDAEPDAESFLHELNEKKEDVTDPEKIIRRNTAYLKLFPDDSISLSNRANAYVDLKKYDLALEDFDKSISIEPDYAFPYYCRGNMFLKIKKPRQALTDLDIACKLEPDDTLYLCGRAEAFYELNKMEKALADCNRAIEIDARYEIAYMTRYNIYLYLGEAEKAEADAAMIDELLAEE